MISIRKLVGVLYLASFFSVCSNAQELDPSQVYTTNNLVGNTGNAWSGCYTNQSGSFWGGTSGGPCPGYDSSTGQIIFSYGQYTLSQTIAINQALANAGTGLQINGYNYSWSVKNSNINGEQPGGYDPITYVDVNLYSNTGSLLVNDRYNYGYHIPNWTSFSGTRIYDNPYSLSAVSNIQLAVTSRDSGYWAGHYGPEFNNFNLSLNYSVDPCVSNPLYSPSCSGYGAAFVASLNSNTASTPTVTYNAASGYTNINLAPDSTRTDPTVQNAGGVELTTSGELSAPDGVPTVTKESSKENKKQQQQIISMSNSIALNTIAKNEKREQSIIKNIQEQNLLQSVIEQQSVVESILREQAVQKRNDTGTSETVTQPSSSTQSGPLNSINQSSNPKPADTSTQTTGPTVNKNVQPNTAAGNMDIAAIAQTPQGFELYMNGMRDGQFYTPKEIYKGQRTVDNARAERFLNGKSDVLHQMMIEQQYNIGN